MARNLAMSLRHYAPTLNIVCYAPTDLHSVIGTDNLTQLLYLPDEYYLTKSGKIDPCKAKCNIYTLGKLAGLTKFLYLDVDALALSDITPLLSALDGSGFNCEIIGRGKVGDRIDYLHWATQKDTIEQFNVMRPNPTLCATQTSWVYFEQGKVAEAVQAHVKWHYDKGYPKHLLINTWGESIPDELIYTGVLAKLGIDPTKPKADREPIFFGNKGNRKSVEHVVANYYILSLYGNGGMNSLTVGTWKRLYDTHVNRMGGMHMSGEIMKDKFVNK